MQALRGSTRLLPALALLLAGACAPLQSWLPAGADAGERIARTVTIGRDEWGVPTIYAPTDAAVVFGIAYAQAEDDLRQLEDDYIHALGWAAWYYGERFIADDLVRAAFDVVRLAREEYEREPVERRALWDAWAAGLNWYLRSTGTAPRFITQWEPWMVFARVRYAAAATTIDSVRLGDIVAVAQRVAPAGADEPASDAAHVSPVAYAPFDGSIAWAAAPSRAAARHALLLHAPHAGFAGSGRHYELHVHGESGWHVRGVAMAGTPLPQAGHSERHAWGHTGSSADHADVYRVVFDHPSDPLLYRWDGDWRRATEWEHELRVNTAAGVERRVYRLRRTHHGPIVSVRGDTAFAVRIARMEDGGSLQQSYALSRATDLDAFRAALDQRALPGSSTMYADAAGNIHYVHGSAVPRRDPAFDWSQPVDGTTSATEWQGWHTLDELPQRLNPRAGWLQSAGASPFLAFLATGDGDDLDAARYPRYMTHAAYATDATNATDAERARSARRMLAADTAWTFDAWARAAFDTYVMAAEDAIDPLVREWEEIGGLQPRRALALDEAVDMLRAWDRVASVESEETTLFVLWQERLRTGAYDGADRHFRALEDALARMRTDHGTTRVAWGDINRLQRVRAGSETAFDADAPSLPVPGAPGWTGTIFRFETRDGPRGLRFGTAGTAWVGAVELAPLVRSRSVVPFGQSADPMSPHFLDQAPLYARGDTKQLGFTRDDVMRTARRVYRPGLPDTVP